MINELVQKVSNLLPDMKSCDPVLSIILRRHKKHSLEHLFKNYYKKFEVSRFIPRHGVDNPIYFDGTIYIPLPQRHLVVHMLGKSIKEALGVGFENLKEEIQKYKGRYFKGHSKYFDRRTLRRFPEEV